MTSRAVMGQKVLFGGVIVFTLGLMLPGGVFARIPEPDNIVYGIAGIDIVTLELKISGETVASYTMGDNPDAGAFYILRVPMDALEPAEPGTGHVDDEADIFLNDEAVAAASITLGERGTIHRLDLQANDSDGDGLPDDWEQQIIDDNPNDGIETIDDVLPGDDYDGDGESNLTEYSNDTDPTDPASAQRGDVNGDKYITLADAMVALQVMCGIDAGIAVSTYGDVNGNNQIGGEEVIFVLQRVSELR